MSTVNKFFFLMTTNDLPLPCQRNQVAIQIPNTAAAIEAAVDDVWRNNTCNHFFARRSPFELNLKLHSGTPHAALDFQIYITKNVIRQRLWTYS